MNKREKEKIIDFLIEANKLKDVKRTGWVAVKIRYPESDAAHVYMVALMASLLSKKLKVNKEKLIDMILIHELNEVYTGDIGTKPDGFRYTLDKKGRMKKFTGDKKKLEERGMKKVLSKLPQSMRKRYYKLWREFEENETNEAKAAHGLDRLDHAILSVLYKKRTKRNLEGFLEVEKFMKNPYLKDLQKIVKKKFSK